jgi:hypothetical protein
MLRILALVLSVALTNRPAFAAQSLQDALASFGLLGTWSPQCSYPVSDSNYTATFTALSPGVGEMRYVLGAKPQERAYSLNFAQIVDGTHVRLDVTQLDNHMNFEWIIRKQANSIQTYSSVQSDGTVLVKDGIFTGSGGTATWLQRCS